MKLPPKVHRKGPSLYYVHGNKWTRLCPADAEERVIHGELWKLLRKGVDTLGAVMDSYKVRGIPKLSLSTQADYANIIENVLRPLCGHMHPDDFTGQDVAAYLELRDEQGRGSRGNKEMAVLSSVYNHGMRIRACISNPCYGVRRNKEKARTVYVDDSSFRIRLRRAPAGFRHLLWAAYLTGFRQQDLRNVERDDCLPSGLRVRQSKDGKHEIRTWTESLRKLVRRALARSRCQYVFTNERGYHWSLSGVQSAMRRLRSRGAFSWRFHDIRAKADSDHETGLGLMRRYNRARKLKAVK
jgi:hypothetical protein